MIAILLPILSIAYLCTAGTYLCDELLFQTLSDNDGEGWTYCVAAFAIASNSIEKQVIPEPKDIDVAYRIAETCTRATSLDNASSIL